MKGLFTAYALIALIAAVQPALAGTTPDQQLVFSDGTKVEAYDHCGDADICAVLQSPNGNTLSIYSEGAAYCQPYILRFVETRADQTVFEYSRAINHDLPTTSAFGTRCGNSRDTQMVMDHGYFHMTVTENNDGTLSLAFTPTKQGTMRKQAQVPSDDQPSPSPSS